MHGDLHHDNILKHNDSWLAIDHAKTGTNNNRIEPGKTLTCFHDYDDTIMMQVEPDDFKNGSTGTYKFDIGNNK